MLCAVGARPTIARFRTTTLETVRLFAATVVFPAVLTVLFAPGFLAVADAAVPLVTGFFAALALAGVVVVVSDATIRTEDQNSAPSNAKTRNVARLPDTLHSQTSAYTLSGAICFPIQPTLRL